MQNKESATVTAPEPAQPKPPYKVKGTLTVLNDNNDCEFRAQRATGESSQEVMAKTGSAKLYKTTGRKPQMVAYLITRADASDPIADLYDQLDTLTEKQAPTAHTRTRGRILLNEECGTVILSKKANVIDMHLQIDLNAQPDYQNQLIRIMQKISTCFVINQIFLQKQNR